jgi:pimeloyl-ACP methyl ester carboxylesterase
VAPDLPLEEPAAGHVERARPALEAISGVADPVVVVGHSMGSAYAALVAAERPGSLLVHLCPRLGGFVEPPGAPRTYREGFPFPPERPDGTSAWEAGSAVAAMYPRLAPEVARELTENLRPKSFPPDEFPLAAPPPNPTVLIYAADDELFEPDWERFMARELLGIEPIEIPGGHFPMNEDPEGLADLLDRLAQDARGS